MATELIKLEDGTLIEVEARAGKTEPIAEGFATKVSETFDIVRPVLVKTCRPIIAAWKELSQEMNIDQAEVELGLSFEAEGNLYITKSKLNANLTVKLVLTPKD